MCSSRALSELCYSFTCDSHWAELQFGSAGTSEPLIFLEHLFSAGQEGGRRTLTDITVQLKHISGSECQGNEVLCQPMASALWGMGFITCCSQLQINRENNTFCPVNHISHRIMPLFLSSAAFLVQFQFSSVSAESQPGWIWISAEPESLLVQCSFLVMIHKLSRNQNAIKIDEYKDYFLLSQPYLFQLPSLPVYSSKNEGWAECVFYVSKIHQKESKQPLQAPPTNLGNGCYPYQTQTRGHCHLWVF